MKFVCYMCALNVWRFAGACQRQYPASFGRSHPELEERQPGEKASPFSRPSISQVCESNNTYPVESIVLPLPATLGAT